MSIAVHQGMAGSECSGKQQTHIFLIDLFRDSNDLSLHEIMDFHAAWRFKELPESHDAT